MVKFVYYGSCVPHMFYAIFSGQFWRSNHQILWIKNEKSAIFLCEWILLIQYLISDRQFFFVSKKDQEYVL
jgi:hypothetical protein